MSSQFGNEGIGGRSASTPPIISRLYETSLRLAEAADNHPETTSYDPDREELIVGAAEAIESALRDGLAFHSDDLGSVPSEAVDETFRRQDDCLALLTPVEQTVAWYQAAERIFGPEPPV